MPGRPSGVVNHPQRTKIVDQLISGVPLRDISLWTHPKISVMTLSRYNNQVVRPTLAANTPKPMDNTQIAQQPTRDVVQQSIAATPVRERLEFLWGKTNGFIGESSVANAAPLLNSAVKQVELLARLSGELRDQPAGTSISISITNTGVEKARIDLSEDGCASIGSKS